MRFCVCMVAFHCILKAEKQAYQARFFSLLQLQLKCLQKKKNNHVVSF